MLKTLEIGGGISFGTDIGIDIGGFDIDTPEPTAQTMTTLDPHDATQFDGIGKSACNPRVNFKLLASCDFILPKLCQESPPPTSEPTSGDTGSLSGCPDRIENDEISVDCGGLTNQVGPNSKCLAVCLNDPIEEQHEAFCRCSVHGCQWELKQPDRCKEINALTCPTPNWSDWPENLILGKG